MGTQAFVFNYQSIDKVEHEVLTDIEFRRAFLMVLDRYYKTADSQVTVPVLSGPNFYQYNTKRFTGWWTKDNPKGRPMIWEGTPERLLHVLDLKPRS